MGDWKKVLDSLATMENISVTDFLHVLNPKHSSYWEENQLYPSQNQDGGHREKFLKVQI